MMDPARLDGRTALVTGASRGIGEHCARALAADGARVALAARDEQLLESVASELDHDPVVIAVDLMAEGAGTELAGRAIAELGGVDIVVNNAGTGEIPGDDAAVLRLNYATELRYGVLVDIARDICDGRPVDLAMSRVNVIWLSDANAMAAPAWESIVSPSHGRM